MSRAIFRARSRPCAMFRRSNALRSRSINPSATALSAISSATTAGSICAVRQPLGRRYFSTAGLRILRGRRFTPEEVAPRSAGGAHQRQCCPHILPRHKYPRPVRAALSHRDRSPDAGKNHRRCPDAILTHCGTSNGTYISPASVRGVRILQACRPDANPGSAARAVEEALRRIDPRVRRRRRSCAIARCVPWPKADARLAVGSRRRSALVLAGLGVYGVTAFVGQRTHEVSVRMALGASKADVLRLLVKDSLRPVIIGLVVGLAAALSAAVYPPP